MAALRSTLKQLDKLYDGYDRLSNIWRQVDRLNLLALGDLQHDTDERNKFINGVRALQSNLRKHFKEKQDIREALDLISVEYKKATTIDEKVKLIFKKYDLLNEVIDDNVEPHDYATREEITEEELINRESGGK